MVICPININSNSHIQALSQIWRACFTEDQSYIDSFINNCLPYTNSWFLLHKDKPVSLLSLLPSYALLPKSMIFPDPLSQDRSDKPSLSIPGISQNPLSNNLSRGTAFSNNFIELSGAYIYGVATLPEHRGNSYSRALLNKAIAYSAEMGFDYIVVKPADESLFEFYRRAGFDTTLYSNRYSINILSSKEGASHFTPLYPDRLFILREQYNPTSLLWPPEILNYAVAEALSRPNAVAVVENNLYLIAYPSETDKKIVHLLESNAETDIQFRQVLSFLQDCYPYATTVSIDCANKTRSQQRNSALLKSLNSNLNITEALSRLYLSLPME